MKRFETTERVSIRLRVNGKDVTGNVEPRVSLVDFLRGAGGLRGVRVGCEHGVCGACTVLRDGMPVRSCLVRAVACEDFDWQTVEGLENPDGSFGRIQNAFHENFSLQCGFCTAGVMLSTKSYLDQHPDPSEDDIRRMLTGHVCRCTGYKQIVDAVLELAGESETVSEGRDHDI